MFAVHFLRHKSSVLALMLMLMILMCFVWKVLPLSQEGWSQTSRVANSYLTRKKEHTLKKNVLIYFQEKKQTLTIPRDWLTNWKRSSPQGSHRPTNTRFSSPTQGCPCANGEVLNMKKRKTASRIAHNLAPGQPHTYKHPQTCAEHFPDWRGPSKGRSFVNFYIDYIWNIDLPR